MIKEEVFPRIKLDRQERDKLFTHVLGVCTFQVSDQTLFADPPGGGTAIKPDP